MKGVFFVAAFAATVIFASHVHADMQPSSIIAEEFSGAQFEELMMVPVHMTALANTSGNETGGDGKATAAAAKTGPSCTAPDVLIVAHASEARANKKTAIAKKLLSKLSKDCSSCLSKHPATPESCIKAAKFPKCAKGGADCPCDDAASAAITAKAAETHSRRLLMAESPVSLTALANASGSAPAGNGSAADGAGSAKPAPPSILRTLKPDCLSCIMSVADPSDDSRSAHDVMATCFATAAAKAATATEEEKKKLAPKVAEEDKVLAPKIEKVIKQIEAEVKGDEDLLGGGLNPVIIIGLGFVVLGAAGMCGLIGGSSETSAPREFRISELSKDEHARYFFMIIELGFMLTGLATFAAGVMGLYWGSKVIHPWPPLTWNTCIGGFFMLVFGSSCFALGLSGFQSAMTKVSSFTPGLSAGASQAEMIGKWAGFLDTFAGRGCFLIYLGLRIMPLGQGYCLFVGFQIIFFAIANLIIHAFVYVGREKACQLLNYISAGIGAICTVAGGMGFYWGCKVIRTWPPLTWNNCVGSFFMVLFGMCVGYLSFKSNSATQDEWSETIKSQMKFLDVFLGRAAMFLYLGLRLLPMGSYYCVMSGFITIGFGMLNVALYFLWDVESIAAESQAALGYAKLDQPVN